MRRMPWSVRLGLMGNEARGSSRKLPPQIGSAGFPLATQWPVPKRLQEPYPPSIHAGADSHTQPTAVMMKRKSPQANFRQITNLGGPPSLMAQTSITEDAETLSRYLLDQANAFHRRRCAAEKWVMRDDDPPGERCALLRELFGRVMGWVGC